MLKELIQHWNPSNLRSRIVHNLTTGEVSVAIPDPSAPMWVTINGQTREWLAWKAEGWRIKEGDRP